MVQVPTPPVGAPRAAPRQARAIATRETILEAAAHEFGAEGYHAASLSKILDRSGVTKGALYFHFASKETMALAVFDVMSDAFPRAVEAFEARHRDTDVLTMAVHLAIGIADLLAADVYSRGGMRIAAEGPVGPERAGWPYRFWEAVFTDMLTRASAEGCLRPGVDPRTLAVTVVALGHGHRLGSTATTDLADLRQRSVESWELLLEHLAVPDWLDRWRAAGGMASVPRWSTEGGPDGAPGPVP